jgi:hypothetical protein
VSIKNKMARQYNPNEMPKLWNPAAASGWSVLLTPIFGSIVVAKNWNTLGRPDRSLMTYYWLAGMIVAYLAVLALHLPLLYVAMIIVWHFAVCKPQMNYMKLNFGNDYPRKSMLKAVLIGFLPVLVLPFTLVVLGASLMGYHVIQTPTAVTEPATPTSQAP